MEVCAIILAAGRGWRFKSKIPKPFVKINSKPIIIYSLLAFNRHPLIKDIIVVVGTKNKKDTINKIRQYHIDKIKRVVKGGRRRQDSVYQGLKAVDPCTNLVIIHDGVRPFIDKNTISLAIKEAKKCGAAIVAVPVKATIKKVTSHKLGVIRKFFVRETIDRANLYEAQTPQVFKKDLLLEAYEKFGDTPVTDDAMLVEKLGAKVGIVLGSYNNIKITTFEDLLIAKALLKAKNRQIRWNIE